MWDFKEKDIELYLKSQKIIKIGRLKYRVLDNQFPLLIPGKIELKSLQTTIFKDVEKMLDKVIRVEGKEKHADILAYKYPKKSSGRLNEISIIEIKNTVASLSDVSQLQQYVNILEILKRHNIKDTNKKLKIKNTYKVKGILLARAIPVEAWFATNDFMNNNPKISLYSFDIISELKVKEIKDLRFKNITKFYRKEFKSKVSKWKKTVRLAKSNKDISVFKKIN